MTSHVRREPTIHQSPSKADPTTIRETRPLSVDELHHFIDMYGREDSSLYFLKPSHTSTLATTTEDCDEDDDEGGLSSDDVAKELKNLQNLRRISLDLSDVDPDLPLQDFDQGPAMARSITSEDGDASDNMYWVYAYVFAWDLLRMQTSSHTPRDSTQGMAVVPTKEKSKLRRCRCTNDHPRTVIEARTFEETIKTISAGDRSVCRYLHRCWA